jgi:putative DNA primase/helicase
MSKISDKQGNSQDGWQWYRKNKLAIFPCYEKKPLTKNGFKSASNDPEKIAAMWEGCPDNTQVGIATGAVNRLLVLDLDSPEAEDYARAQGWLDQETFSVETSKEYHKHYYFLQPTDVSTKSTAGQIFKGLDVRGDGGYVIGPGSIHHETGLPYTPVSFRVKRARVPESLLKVVLAIGDPEPARAIKDKIPQGQRDQTLTSMAGTLRRRGASEKEILATLCAMNQRCDPPLPEKDLRKIARSIGSKPAGPPREVTTAAVELSLTSETANAVRFVDRHETDFRFCSDREIWCAWDGRLWNVGDYGAVMRCFKELPSAIYAEALRSGDETRKQLLAWGLKSESLGVQQHAVTIARYFPGIEVRRFADVFDLPTRLFNFANGSVQTKEKK